MSPIENVKAIKELQSRNEELFGLVQNMRNAAEAQRQRNSEERSRLHARLRHLEGIDNLRVVALGQQAHALQKSENQKDQVLQNLRQCYASAVYLQQCIAWTLRPQYTDVERSDPMQ